MKSDWFAEAFGEAVSSVRGELIDRAWFDRRPEASKPDLGWTHEEETKPEHSQEPSREEDRGIER